MSANRFKIDVCGSKYEVFGLFFAEPRLFGVHWREVDRFKTRDEAKAFYELIKDLPEYLP